MKISTKGRYALRMMLDLSLHDTGEFISLRDISQRQNITVKYLEGDILRVMEGSLNPVACVAEAGMCDMSADCAVLPFWKNFAKVINNYVDSVTLQDLKDQALAMIGNDFVI